MTESHEDGSLSPAPGVPRRGAPAQLQQRGARARRLAVGGEPVGAAARGAAPGGAARPHDAQRVADGRGKAPRGGGRPWARPGAGRPRQRVGPTRRGGGSAAAVGPTDGGALRHQPGAAHLSRAPPAGGGKPAQVAFCTGSTLIRNDTVIPASSSAPATTTSATSRSASTAAGSPASASSAGDCKAGGLHRAADAGRRLLRDRLRRPRDGPPVRRQPHLQRHPAATAGWRQPQRRHLGRARQRLVDHGLRRHLRPGRPAAAQRPVLLAAQHRRDQRLRRRRRRARPQRGADRLAARTSTATATRSRLAYNGASARRRSSAARTTRPPGSRRRSSRSRAGRPRATVDRIRRQRATR